MDNVFVLKNIFSQTLLTKKFRITNLLTKMQVSADRCSA